MKTRMLPGGGGKLHTKKYRRCPSQLPFMDLSSLEAERSVLTARRRWEEALVSGPRDDISHQALSRLTVTNHEFLSSCAIHIRQEDHCLRSIALRRHTAHLWQFPLTHKQTECLGPERCIRCMIQMRQYFAHHLVAPAFWTWEVHKAQNQSWSVPLQNIWEPE